MRKCPFLVRLIMTFLLATHFGIAAAQKPASDVLENLRLLSGQTQGFSGQLSWSFIILGAGADVLKLESMRGDEAYKALYDGKEINDLPNASIEWRQLTSTPLVQKSMMAWYDSINSNQIDERRANSISKDFDALESDWNSASAVAPAGFQFSNKKTDTVTSAGLHVKSLLQNGDVKEWISLEGSIEHDLHAFPNPLRWSQSASVWNQILERGNWSGADLKNLQVELYVDRTTYTMSINDQNLPETIKVSKVVEGGWNRVILSEYSAWKQIGKYWLPGMVVIDVSLVAESLSAPISKQFIVLNNFDPTPS